MQAIISDLDGTLLNAEHEVSDFSVKALKLAQSKGIGLIAATGRSWNTAYPRFQNAGIACDFILLNGAEFRNSSGQLLLSHKMDLAFVLHIVQQLTQHQIDFEINTSNGDYSTNTQVCTTALPFNKSNLQAPGCEVRKVFAFSDTPVKVQSFRNTIPAASKITVTSSDRCNLEFTSIESQKGLMLERVLELYQLSKYDVVIFGDGENDLSLFQRFPHTRAMGNAVPALMGMAEKVIGYHYQDGVATEVLSLLEKLII